MWIAYDNKGWPARYLFDQRGMLFDYHFGEGGYAETERAIQELLGVERDLVEPRASRGRPGRADRRADPGPARRLQRARTPPAACGRCSRATARSASTASRCAVTHPGAYPLLRHERHTEGVLELVVGDGVTCHATCFTPGLAPA